MSNYLVTASSPNILLQYLAPTGTSDLNQGIDRIEEMLQETGGDVLPVRES